jgi:hypothetical protein
MDQDNSEDPRIVRLQEEIADLRLVLGYAHSFTRKGREWLME